MAIPSGATKLRYIQATGEQRINTGFYPNQDTRLVCKISGLPNAAQSQSPFGTRTSTSSSDRFSFIAAGTGTYRSDFYNNNVAYSSGVSFDDAFVIDKNKNVTTLNGETSVTHTTGTFTASYPLWLFDMNTKGASSAPAEMCLWYCQIYDNGTLVRDFIPVQLSTGEVGMWDNVNSVFYGDAAGVGFVAGPLPHVASLAGEVGGTIVDGTIFPVIQGKTLVDGTAYDIMAGKTLVAGTAYDIGSSLPPVGTALNDMTWEEVRAISDAGLAADYFAVGDTKTIIINGTVNGYTFSNLSIDAFIIGIDHNSAIEGTNRIHFQIGKINGTDVCLVDNGYSLAANIVDSTGAAAFYMIDPELSADVENTGGWKSCYGRSTVLGSDSAPTSPRASTLLAALPSDLRAVMKSVTKYTDNKGDVDTYGTASCVTATTDYLPLLCEYELYGVRSDDTANAMQLKLGANPYEANYTKQYDYYAAGNSRLKRKHTVTTRVTYWWLRSPQGKIYFTVVNTDGTSTLSSNSNRQGLAPAFAV